MPSPHSRPRRHPLWTLDICHETTADTSSTRYTQLLFEHPHLDQLWPGHWTPSLRQVLLPLLQPLTLRLPRCGQEDHSPLDPGSSLPGYRRYPSRCRPGPSHRHGHSPMDQRASGTLRSSPLQLVTATVGNLCGGCLNQEPGDWHTPALTHPLSPDTPDPLLGTSYYGHPARPLAMG